MSGRKIDQKNRVSAAPTKFIKLNVIYAGWGERWQLGTLADDGRQVLFEYSAEARTKALELSPLHLPLAMAGASRGEPFFMGLPGMVADALPDGWGLLLMDRWFRQLGRNPAEVSVLERLALLGDHALGALAFEPATQAADELWADEPMQSNLHYLAAAADQQQRASADASRRPTLCAKSALREMLQLGGSPQGARPKVLVNYNASTGQIDVAPGVGVAGPASAAREYAPWLIKFPARGEHWEVCAVEELYARVARHCGIAMPSSRFFDLGSGAGDTSTKQQHYSAFGVARFDREDGLRVPVHSLSGLLHADYRMPSLDYDQLLRATRRLTGDEREVTAAFARAVFNVAMHNRDDHARNFEWLLSRDRRWRLAPAFDLTFSNGPRGQHTMTIAGEGRAPMRGHLLALARSAGMATKTAPHTIDAIVSGCAALPELARDLPIRKKTLSELQTTVNAMLVGLR